MDQEGSPGIGEAQNCNKPILSNQLILAQEKNALEELDESPKRLIGVSARLKTLLHRDTPIKEKLNEENKIEEGETNFMDRGVQNRNMINVDRRITRSQSRNNSSKLVNLEFSDSRSGSDSSNWSTNVTQR
ncbi:hypothetical protein L2E82_45737 [Cichorium intybus]|uniref:Uncharacterized protein n=1 Tax=Cichorium intybus TaxID=13427 RepID=A0ACB8ZU52_CICIN|nr:hypothetical protein L2E82_45737 [Cichorium intybus]